jgi:hypothetical protein
MLVIICFIVNAILFVFNALWTMGLSLRENESEECMKILKMEETEKTITGGL